MAPSKRGREHRSSSHAAASVRGEGSPLALRSPRRVWSRRSGPMGPYYAQQIWSSRTIYGPQGRAASLVGVAASGAGSLPDEVGSSTRPPTQHAREGGKAERPAGGRPSTRRRQHTDGGGVPRRPRKGRKDEQDDPPWGRCGVLEGPRISMASLPHFLLWEKCGCSPRTPHVRVRGTEGKAQRPAGGRPRRSRRRQGTDEGRVRRNHHDGGRAPNATRRRRSYMNAYRPIRSLVLLLAAVLLATAGAAGVLRW